MVIGGSPMLGDVRQTLRFLAREPLLAVAMVVTLALGIGATTAIFSVLDAVITLYRTRTPAFCSIR
jgi:hypothetical protein